MVSMEEVQHIKAAGAASITGASWLGVWLTDIDMILRVILTLVGIATGIYSTLYYRKRYKEK